MPFSPLYRTREIARVSCLRAFAGRQSIRSGVFDASTLSLTTLTNPVAYTNIYGSALQTLQVYTVPIGTFLTRSTTDPTKVKAYTGAGTNQNDVQTVTITGTPTGGTFTLTFNGQTTAPIAYNATAAATAAAVAALPNVGVGNIGGTGGALPGTPVVLTFAALLGNAPQNVMTANGAGLTGGSSPNVTVAHTTPGTTAESIIGVYDGPDRDFFSNVVAADEAIPIYFHSCDFDITKLQNWLTYGVAAKAALPTCEFY